MFRGFASRLREQAKDAVGNYKLPTFDDMAKNDEYIHSPDFNVREGTGTRKNKATTGSLRTEEESNAGNSVATNLNMDEASYYSTESSSWSLLDRPSSTVPLSDGKTTGLTTLRVAKELNYNDEDDQDQHPQKQKNNNQSAFGVPGRIVEQTPEVVRPIKTSNSNRQKASNSSVSLLSVVSDVLQSEKPLPSKDYDYESGHNKYSRNEGEQYSVDRNDDSDNSSEDFDDEDPILFMIRKESNITLDRNNVVNSENQPQNNDLPTPVAATNKSSKRFMEDIRLQSPLHLDQNPGAVSNIHSTTTTETKSSTNRGPFDGFFKNSAIENFNRIILRRGIDNDNQARTPPPLARGRKQKAESQGEENFEVTTSTSVGILGDEDLAKLNQMNAAGKSSLSLISLSSIQSNMQVFIEYLRSNQRFLFVAFTLVLSIIVYFRIAETL